MKLLIVDDNVTNLKLLDAILRADGHLVVSARDGIEALAKAESEPFDVIISDILMPRMDGYRLCYEIRTHERLRDIPFIVYTATYTSNSDEQLSMDLGADRFFRKPAAAEQILQAVQDVVANPRERMVKDPGAEAGIVLMKEYSERLVAKLEEKNIELGRKVEELSESERRLREQEESYRTLFDYAPDGIIIADTDGKFIDVNAAICSMLGYSRNEVMALGPAGVAASSDRRLIDPVLAQVRAGFGHHRRWRLQRKDGTEFDAEVIAALMPNGSLMAMVRDISERLESERIRDAAEQEIAAGRERLAGIISSAMDAIVSIDEDQKVVLFNSAAETMFQCAASEAIGKPIDRFIPTRFRADHKNHVQSFGRTHITRRSMSSLGGLFGLRADGEEFPIEASISQVESRGKKTYTVILRDITERQRAEQEIRKSEERYRDLVENAHDIIYSHDLNGNYTSVNRAGELITGYSHEEALKLNMLDTVAPEYLETAREMVAAKLKGDESTSYELEILAKDGRRIAVEVNTKLIVSEGVPVGVQGIARDITSRKQLEDQLRQSQKMEAIGQLAGGIAHDFNNLLTVILGYSQILLAALPSEDPRRRSVDAINQAGERAASLTSQLLAFSRKALIQPEELDLNDAVRDTEKMLRRLIGENVELTVRLDPSIGRVLVDPGQLGQVFVNLVLNGRDAMPEGGKLLVETFASEVGPEYVAQHPYAEEGRYVVMAVTDTGCGMPPEIKSRIFEPFFTTKGQGKGTGLGLAMVYGIVKQSGGHIEVYSEIGKGSSFKVYFPEIEDGSGSQRLSGEQPSVVLEGTERVLVVEDEAMVRDLAVRTLRSFGYDTLSAADGAEAQSVIAEHGEIDLLFTDVVMPGISGLELASIVSAKQPDLKILFSSGYTDDTMVLHQMLDPTANFLQKPYSIQNLLKKIREILDAG